MSETYAQDLVSTMQSPTFYTSSRGGPTSVSLYAHDTVYRYGSDESAREAFESIDADLFAACISLNVTPGSEDAVADHVVDEDDRSIDGHDGIVLRTDAMQDSTFFGGYDNEREADLIAVLLGTEVIVFEFVVSGQSVDFLGVDPLDAELDAVESVLERAGP